MKIALFALFVVFPLLASAEDPLCAIAKTSFEEAIQIRGRAKRRDVPCKVQNIEEVKRFLLQTIKEKNPPLKMEREEILYKALGMLPQDFDYQKNLIEFYASQAGGYYDPERKYFVMAAWMPGILQSTVAVHELTHALQDQYYDLEKFTDVDKFTTDELLARLALIEGDATAVMTDAARKMMGKKGIASEKNIDGIMLQNAIGFSIMSGNVALPKGLQLLLFFPYTSGLRFVHQLLQQEGYRTVDAAFERVPQSTAEILHPEKYFKKTGDNLKLSAEAVFGVNDENLKKLLYSDSLGEFFISALLQGLSEDGRRAAEAASGWAADRALIIEQETGKKVVYWLLQWETVEDLREFSASYSKRLDENGRSGSYTLNVDEEALQSRLIFTVN